jgi:peptidoglycan L-alanyl-D-glutamate endopeptidase CwlK
MRNILTLDEDLQAVLIEDIKTAPIDYCVYCGHRGEKAQNAAYDAKKSQLRYPASNHNQLPSRAFDFAPYHRKNPHIRWDDTAEFKKVAKHIMKTAKKMGIELEYGGDWENFKDYPHIQKAST